MRERRTIGKPLVIHPSLTRRVSVVLFSGFAFLNFGVLLLDVGKFAFDFVE